MKRLRLSARERRTITIGLAVAAAILIPIRVLPIVRDWSADARISAAELGAEARRAAASVAQLDATVDSIAARRERLLALAPRLIPAEARAIAGSHLSALVAGAAAGANVRLGGVRHDPDTASAGVFARIAIHVDATADVRGLADFLLALERSTQRIIVSRISITQPAPAVPDQRPEELRIELVVEGLALLRGSPAVLGDSP